jgi:hypothetical protein
MGPSPSWTGTNIRLHLPDLAEVCLDQDRAPTASAYPIGETFGGAIIIEPVERHVGTSRSKFQRHCAADALLCARDQNHLASELHTQPPRMPTA